MSELRITIPGLPPRECSPNARSHWAVKAGHAAGYRLYVKLHARDQIRKQTGKWEAVNCAHLDITFVVPDRRRRDKTNLAASFKAGLDGIVDAGIIVDDSHEHCDDQYHVRYEKGVSKVVVEVS